MYYKLYKEIENRIKYVWNELVKQLSDEYEEVVSCNNDISRYLVPKGTADQITYYGKPKRSLRMSDHWSWYANIQKCRDESYVQCANSELKPHEREIEGGASKPIKALQICILDDNGVYCSLIGIMNEMTDKSVDHFIDMPVNMLVEQVKFLIHYKGSVLG